jgi:hypothetical protein
MDHRRRSVRSLEEVNQVRSSVIEAVEKTSRWLRSLEHQPMQLFRSMRFTQIGTDPLTHESLNIIEQLNQTFTILCSLRAVEILFKLHPSIQGFSLAMATCGGRDIQSIESELLAAEVFCATHPYSNQKLKKDIARMSTDNAKHRYVFFASPAYIEGRVEHLETCEGVQVYAIGLP